MTGDTVEGGQSATDPINSSYHPSQTTPDGDEIETSANHVYDDLINYTSQACHANSECSQIDHKISISGTSVEVGISDTKKTVDLTKDEDDSMTHTYAVLEEAVPPVPERCLSLSLSLLFSFTHTHTHSGKHPLTHAAHTWYTLHFS